MTTKRSPLRVLRAQAERIADLICTIECGDHVNEQFAEKLMAARDKESVRFAIAMDDKIITIDMPWSVIRDTGRAGLAEYILNQMRETRHTEN